MIPIGFVATTNSQRRTLLHLMRPTLDRTLCGLWTINDILPEDTPCGDARPCGLCAQTVRLKEATQ